jgi:hypothetical protein
MVRMGSHLEVNLLLHDDRLNPLSPERGVIAGTT